MKVTSIAIGALTLILLVGCKNQNQSNAYSPAPSSGGTSVAGTNLSPEELGKLGAEIKKHPNDARKLLSEHGLTEQSFEQAIRKVSESPEASKRYTAAYKKARA
jgi:hypothetical protein